MIIESRDLEAKICFLKQTTYRLNNLGSISGRKLKTRNFQVPVSSWEGDHSNFIYSLMCSGSDSVATGGGEGRVVVRDRRGLKRAEVQAEKNAVRCMQMTESEDVVLAGDDGDVILLTN